MGADEAAQVAHIEAYEALLNRLGSDERSYAGGWRPGLS
jgi:hypothetical protein